MQSLSLSNLSMASEGIVNVVPQIITATITPAMSPLVAGESVDDVTNYATMIDTANFASSAGTISSAVVAFTGDAVDATTALTEGQTAGFTVTVTDSAANERVFNAGQVTVAGLGFSVESVGSEPAITANGGNLSVTVSGGTAYDGTYTTDVDGATLTVAAVEANPAAIVKPSIAGTAGEGNTLTVTPGLWVYDGPDPGDQTWQWQRDGVDISGATGLTYVQVSADGGAAITVVETFAGQTVTSDAFTVQGVPSAFVDADWSVATGSGGNEVDITIASLPTDNGSAITDVEYDIDASGTWLSLGTATTGTTTVTMAAPDTSYAFRLRAVNGNGNAAPGNSESATSGAAAGVTLANDTGMIFDLNEANATVTGTDVDTIPNVSDARGMSAIWGLTLNSGANKPQRNTGFIEFRTANDTTISSLAADRTFHPMYTAVVTNGGTYVEYLVMETLNSNSNYCATIAVENNMNNQSSIGYRSDGAAGSSTSNVLVYLSAAHLGGDAYGNKFGATNPAGANFADGLHLFELRVDSTTLELYVDGVLQHTESVTSANIPALEQYAVALGGLYNTNNGNHTAAANMNWRRWIVTETTDTALRDELMTEYGL